jgi:hypothetical protein
MVSVACSSFSAAPQVISKDRNRKRNVLPNILRFLLAPSSRQVCPPNGLTISRKRRAHHRSTGETDTPVGGCIVVLASLSRITVFSIYKEREHHLIVRGFLPSYRGVQTHRSVI